MDFAKVYADHKENIWRLVCRYVFSPSDREDLFQEVFLNVYRALPRFRGESSIGTWLYRIAVNSAINYLKKQNRYKRVKKVLQNLRMVETEAPSEAEDFLKPLEKLNPQQRMVLVLSDIEEVKLEEISRIMKVPLGTVKSTLHRARERLKKELKENG